MTFRKAHSKLQFHFIGYGERMIQMVPLPRGMLIAHSFKDHKENKNDILKPTR